MVSILYRIFQQLFGRSSTNVFPSKHTPPSIKKVMEQGEVSPAVNLPKGFRGKLLYDYDKCIGCGMCIKVCPAKALEGYKVMDEKKGRPSQKIVFFRGRCTFCDECAMVCPVKAIELSQNFMMANYESFGDDQIEGMDKRREFEIREEQSETVQEQ